MEGNSVQRLPGTAKTKHLAIVEGKMGGMFNSIILEKHTKEVDLMYTHTQMIFIFPLLFFMVAPAAYGKIPGDRGQIRAAAVPYPTTTATPDPSPRFCDLQRTMPDP